MKKEVTIGKFRDTTREMFGMLYSGKGLEASVFDEKIWPVLWYNIDRLTFCEVMKLFLENSADHNDQLRELYFERLLVIARESAACDIGQKETREAFGKIGRNNPTQLRVAFEIHRMWLEKHAVATIDAWRNLRPCPDWDDIAYPSGIAVAVDKGGEQ